MIFPIFLLAHCCRLFEVDGRENLLLDVFGRWPSFDDSLDDRLRLIFFFMCVVIINVRPIIKSWTSKISFASLNAVNCFHFWPWFRSTAERWSWSFIAWLFSSLRFWSLHPIFGMNHPIKISTVYVTLSLHIHLLLLPLLVSHLIGLWIFGRPHLDLSQLLQISIISFFFVFFMLIMLILKQLIVYFFWRIETSWK